MLMLHHCCLHRCLHGNPGLPQELEQPSSSLPAESALSVSGLDAFLYTVEHRQVSRFARFACADRVAR